MLQFCCSFSFFSLSLVSGESKGTLFVEARIVEKFINLMFPIKLQGARYTLQSDVGAAEVAVGKHFHGCKLSANWD